MIDLSPSQYTTSELTDERQPICEALHCEQDATAFDPDRLMFVCELHAEKREARP